MRRRLWIALLALLSTCGAPAYAGRPRPQEALLEGPCEGEYVLLAKWGPTEKELARVSCDELPKCVPVLGLWPDSMVLGRFTYIDEFGTPVATELPAVRDDAAVCPE